MWPFSSPTTTDERHAAVDVAHAATAADLARDAVEAQRVAETKLAAARDAAAERDRVSAAEREQEAADLLVKQRVEFETARKAITVAGLMADLAPDVAAIVALNKQLRPIVARIEGKIGDWNARGRECEALARTVGESYYAPTFAEVNARGIVGAALHETSHGAKSLHEWLAARRP